MFLNEKYQNTSKIRNVSNFKFKKKQKSFTRINFYAVQFCAKICSKNTNCAEISKRKDENDYGIVIITILTQR